MVTTYAPSCTRWAETYRAGLIWTARTNLATVKKVLVVTYVYLGFWLVGCCCCSLKEFFGGVAGSEWICYSIVGPGVISLCVCMCVCVSVYVCV